MSKDVEKFLGNYSPEVCGVALKLCELIRRLAPDAKEKVYTGWRIIAFSYRPGMKGQFCAVAPHKGHVNVYFMRGTDLADPGKHLEGTGKKMRHVKIRTPKDAQAKGLKALIKAAATLARSQI